MRPLRSLNKKGSVDETISRDAQSRLLASFSKANSKISDKNTTYNLAQTTVQLFSSCSKQDKTKKHMSAVKYNTQSLCLFEQQPIQRISMTVEQSLSQKQGLIEHLKLQLQESRYIITSLRQQVKELTKKMQESSLNRKQLEKCKKCEQNCKKCQLKDSEIEYLRQSRKSNQEHVQMYQKVIKKLHQKVQNLKKQNLYLNSVYQLNDPLIINPSSGQSQQQEEQEQTSSISTTSLLKENKNIQNNYDLSINIKNKIENITLNEKNINQIKLPQKENHPSTPKNNPPIAFFNGIHLEQKEKENLPRVFGREYTTEEKNSHIERKKSPTSSKQKAIQSPYRLKERLLSGSGRKNLAPEQLFQNQNNCLNLNSKLSKKIYF